MKPDKVRILIQVGYTRPDPADMDNEIWVTRGERRVTLDTALNIAKSMKDEVAYQSVKAFTQIMDELEMT